MHTVAYTDMQEKQLNKSWVFFFFKLLGMVVHTHPLPFLVHTFKPSIKSHKQISVTL